jgi:hypothetical protein
MDPDEHAPTPFDPASVKLGNLKDEVKIAEKIEAARVQHEENQRQRRARYEQDFLDEAALDAETGQILAIGYHAENGGQTNEFVAIEPEKYLLEQFWESYAWAKAVGLPMVGFNIFKFDLPYIIRRSWKHGLPVPKVLEKGRYWDSIFVDLMAVWGCGNQQKYIGLDDVCTFFGLPGKNGDGAQFAKLLATDRAAAEAYLLNDIQQTLQVAIRMGVAG